MASIEEPAPEQIKPLTAADLPGALRLSNSAHWNQSAGDWQMMLAAGQGWCIHAMGGDGHLQLAASVIVLPYGTRFAWVSMVLVLPEFQRRGYAQALLQHALAWVSARGLTAVLDATPAGHAVYERVGFVDTWGFARHRREGGERDAAPAPAPALTAARPLQGSDWPAILALDAPAFGASREQLLRALWQRWPRGAWVVEEAGRLRGFVFGRSGREAHQIGPLIADDTTTAQQLISAALRDVPGAAYVDLCDPQKALLPWLQQQGFVLQRPFTRMVWGATSAPGDNASVVLVAGPELG